MRGKERWEGAGVANLFARALKGQYTRLALAFSLVVAAQSCFLLLPLQLPVLTAAMDSEDEVESARLIFEACSRMVGLYLLRTACGGFGRHLLDGAGDRLLLKIQDEIFQSSIRGVSAEKFELDLGVGAVLSSLEHDSRALRDVITVSLERVVSGAIYVCVGIGLCFYIHAWLTLCVFGAILPIGLSTVYLKRVSESFGRSLSDKRQEVSDRARWILGSSWRLVRSHNMEDFEARGYRSAGEALIKVSGRASAFMQAMKGVTGLTHSAALMVVIYGGIKRASHDEGFTSGSLVALINIVVEVGKHLEMCLQHYLLITSSVEQAAKCERIISAGKRETEGKEARAGGGHGDRIRGREGAPLLEFEDVRYRYGSGEGGEGGVDGMSFEVGRGQVVCLVGPSGCGKSTTLDLVSKFRTSYEGKIRVLGRSIDALDDKVLRSVVAWVGQSHKIVPGRTIRENITYGLPFASDWDVREAVRLASCDDFIEFGDSSNLDRVLEKDGFSLSGGQQARIGVARLVLWALRTEPALLLLDEICANLDSKSEQKILSSVKRLATELGMGCLLVTHRMQNAAAIADRILVVEGGRIVQSGTHEELRQRSGMYQTLCKLQES